MYDFTYDNSSEIAKDNSINIYELGNKCRVWALREGYETSVDLEVFVNTGVWWIVTITDCKTHRELHSDSERSEPKVILKAIEWLLDEEAVKEAKS